MGFLSPYKATEKVDLEDGYFANVKVYLSTADHAAAEKVMMKIGLSADSKGKTEQHTDFDHGAYKIELAALALVNWNLTDDDDIALPAETLDQKRASVAQLPRWVVDKLFAVVKDKPRGKSEGADFPDGDSGSSEG